MTRAHDNLEEYRDAITYDSEYGRVGMDGRFFSALATETGNPVLELACGTGRVTVPLAEQGFDLTGVDVAPEMLERAREKSRAKGLSIEWLHGDCCDMDLGRKFRLVFMTGNAFQAFLTRESQQALLQNVLRHLDDDGLFAFETRNPNVANLCLEDPDEKDVTQFLDQRGYEVHVTGTQQYDPVNQIQHCSTVRRWTDASGLERTAVTRIDLRYTFPQELAALLDYNGFVLERQYGHFDMSPFTENSPLMVSVCKKRR